MGQDLREVPLYLTVIVINVCVILGQAFMTSYTMFRHYSSKAEGLQDTVFINYNASLYLMLYVTKKTQL